MMLITFSLLYIFNAAKVSSFSPVPPFSTHKNKQCGKSIQRDNVRLQNTDGAQLPNNVKWTSSTTSPTPAENDFSRSSPTTFRESEIFGLQLMQRGQYADALDAFTKGMKLPGSRMDIIRTSKIKGPSPVGGSAGGTDGQEVWSLDEFEFQAAYYNMACAYAKLEQVDEAVINLRNACDSGFDNYSTISSDPDLRVLHGTKEFEEFMEEVMRKRKGFFSFF